MRIIKSKSGIECFLYKDIIKNSQVLKTGSQDKQE